ncbi:TIGR03083 family protein [Jatrophihabitans endophyticus]|uniref:TIGR03083 family protein n=1 Tax=Jatrophihabitans endophyticus TaxID=1206085 RepID=A0A1M5QZ12_9ACTN|nr:maleylpyruvate isomerase family mycothiol-dependent enzyme [Jatrophihabitans endophyticus]SHH19171.1 TIGR03083 family protein [Jatrophihabitans endophyticus]
MAVDLLAHVRTESDRFAAALRDADLAARVPSCPDWTAADLLWHLAEVHHFWAVVVGERIVDGDAAEAAGELERPDSDAALFEVYERTTTALLDALAGAEDTTPVWTWAPEQEVGFVRRFQAHEALMHRVDAELVSGAPTPLPAELAADGIEVVTRYTMTWRPGWATWTPSGGVGLLHATDTGTRVVVRPGSWGGHSPDTGKDYADEPAVELVDKGRLADTDPTFTVSAPAADLDAWLWNRPGFGEVDVTGSEADYERFRAQVTAGVQ